MKKHILTLSAFLLVILFTGCEKDFNGPVEPGVSTYKVILVNNFTEVNYGLQDSTIHLWIQLENDKDVTSAYCTITGPDGKSPAKSNINLTKKNSRYSGEYTLKYSDIVGQYTVKYYINDAISGTKLAAAHYFEYDNGQANIAPVLSDISAPDTVTLDPEAATPFILTVKVSDANGKGDIASVIFNTYKPSGGITSASPIEMFDDGSAAHGDATADDGIYSRGISLPSSGVELGTYKFEFIAKDRRGLESIKLIHNIVVKQ
jgi:hypothetical protein